MAKSAKALSPQYQAHVLSAWEGGVFSDKHVTTINTGGENEDKSPLSYFRHLLCQHLPLKDQPQLPKETDLSEHN